MQDYEMKAGFQYDMVVNTRWDITDLPKTRQVVEFKNASYAQAAYALSFLSYFEFPN